MTSRSQLLNTQNIPPAQTAADPRANDAKLLAWMVKRIDRQIRAAITHRMARITGRSARATARSLASWERRSGQQRKLPSQTEAPSPNESTAREDGT